MDIQAYSSYGMNSLLAGLGTFSSGTLQVRAREDDQAVSRAFAKSVVERIPDQAQEQEGQSGQETLDTGPLAESLAGAMDFLREEFGREAATAAMGLVYKNIGDSPVTEESLGKGLVAAVGFIDRNFGFAAGDKVMRHFNGALNNALNDTFDNGLNETFFAAPSGAAGAKSVFAGMLAGVEEQFGEEASSAVLDILKQGLEDGDLRQALADAESYLQNRYGADPAALSSGLPSQQQVGSTLDLTV